MNPDLSDVETAVDRLTFSDQLSLMEHLARRIRERSEHPPGSRDRVLEEMANDPAIQRELQEIDAEFSMTERDGLQATP